MLQIVMTIIVLVAFDVIYRIINRKNRRYNYSPVYLRIEKIYDSWYSKNIRIINNHKASVTKIREIIFKLVNKLKKDGLKKKDISGYYNIISNTSNKNNWATVVTGILAVIGGNEIIKSISGDLYKELVESNLLKQLSKIDWLNNKIASLVIYFVLLIILTFLFIRFSYILITSDSSKRDNMKKAIFQEVEILYEKDKVDIDNTDLRSPFEIACDEAFIPIKFEWANWLKNYFINLIEKLTVLRIGGLIILLISLGILCVMAYEIAKISNEMHFIRVIFVVIIIFIFILIFFVVDYIHGWCKVKVVERNKLKDKLCTSGENFTVSEAKKLMKYCNFKMTIMDNNTRIQFQSGIVRINMHNSGDDALLKTYQIEDLKLGLKKAKVKIYWCLNTKSM